jgi:hypothetical protein
MEQVGSLSDLMSYTIANDCPLQLRLVDRMMVAVPCVTSQTQVKSEVFATADLCDNELPPVLWAT